jgi:hypothetical protein
MARPLPPASRRHEQQGNEYAGNVSSLPYRFTKEEKQSSFLGDWEGVHFLNKLFFTCSKTSLAVNLFLSYWLYLPPPYITEYARTTSTMGARQSGHLPPLRTSSFAHFEQVHMCPHLPSSPERFKALQITHHIHQLVHKEPEMSCGTHLYSRESICESQHTQQVPVLTWFHFDPSSHRSIDNPDKHKQFNKTMHTCTMSETYRKQVHLDWW